jgi:hypothetical protein
MLGEEALDWLFVLGADVWVTDMVREEALRAPDEGGDRRAAQRAMLAAWFTRNVGRIHIEPTPIGQDYARNMRNWIGSGSKPEDRPRRQNLGELTIAGVLSVIDKLIADGEAAVLLVDDRGARALLAQAALSEGLDADIMATETFLRLLEEDFALVAADTAWHTISLACGGTQPARPVLDPVYVRGR